MKYGVSKCFPLLFKATNRFGKILEYILWLLKKHLMYKQTSADCLSYKYLRGPVEYNTNAYPYQHAAKKKKKAKS